MEMHLGYCLKINQDVDHIDGNQLNDELSNLRVVLDSEHVRIHNKTLKSQIFICPNCKNPFVLTGLKLSNAYYSNQRSESGPYCSRFCASSAMNKIRRGRKFESAIIIREYYVPHDQMQGVK